MNKRDIDADAQRIYTILIQLAKWNTLAEFLHRIGNIIPEQLAKDIWENANN